MDGKSFWIGLTVGAAIMLVVCVALLFGTAALLLKHQRARAANSYPATALCPLAGDAAVTDILKPIRQKFGVPAMAAALVTSAGIQFVGAVGAADRQLALTRSPGRRDARPAFGFMGRAG